MARAGDPRYFCGKCREEIGPSGKECPRCGAILSEVHRHITVSLEDQMPPMHDSIKGKLRRPGIRKALLEFRSRSKVAGKSKRPAQEAFIVDRTGAKTKVKHRVQEVDEAGNWVTVHEHEK